MESSLFSQRSFPLKRCATLLSLLIILLALQINAQAWNKAGHMVVGALAYRELKSSDPQAVNRVVSILRQHPWYQQRWLPAINSLNINDPDKHDLYLFMLAAKWPDDIRGTNLHCGDCHYINYPYKPPGQPASMQVQGPAQVNILNAYQRNVDILLGNGSNSVKAMALCWIFHLVGDVHQPLHTAKLFTTVFPDGDRGGTWFYIRADEEAYTISLHKFWDDSIMGSQRYQSVRNRADNLRQRPELRRNVLTELSKTKFDGWARDESFEAAKSFGYRFGQLEGSADEEDGAILPPDYASSIKPIAERRAMAAGYRLSDLLRGWFLIS